MNIRNKYISIGLGTAIAFTSTYFNYGYFTARDIQQNSITILEKAQNDYNFSFGKLDIDDCHWYDDKKCDHEEIELKYSVDKSKNQSIKFDLIDSSDLFEGTKLEHDKADKELDIKINDNTIKNMTRDYTKDPQLLIKVSIINEDGSEEYSQTYAIWFKRLDNGNHKIDYKYTPVGIKSDISVDNSEIPDEVPPKAEEEIPDEVPPNNEGGSTTEDNTEDKGENDSTSEDNTEDKEENDDSSEDNIEKPEERPSKPETDKPSTGEDTQNPEHQPDTPTPLPLEE